ncbi:MAG: hypothetical protein HOO06_09940 [Bdellovibrionaceae bacterium]|jgi:chemotaxis protein MotA|nr:hypothetical protein [Pseudobdellovibrionaceae bacterium]
MNINSIIGFSIAFLVFYFGIFENAASPELFLDTSSIIIVVGGTMATFFIIFPLKKISDLFDFFFLKVIFKSRRTDIKVAKNILSLFFDKDVQQELSRDKKKYHPFLVESIYLVKKNNFSANELNSILSERIQLVKKAYSEDSNMLTILAKFPPAFGLLGSVTGIISMMTGLGEGGAEKIGPAMAVTLVTTFWGIAIANLILLPLADHAHKAVQEETHTRNMIKAAMLSIHLKNNSSFLLETLLSFIPIRERYRLKDYYEDHIAKNRSIISTHSSSRTPQRKSS